MTSRTVDVLFCLQPRVKKGDKSAPPGSWVRQQIVITARKPEGLDVFDAVRKVAESHRLDDGQLRYCYAKFSSEPDTKEECFVLSGRLLSQTVRIRNVP